MDPKTAAGNATHQTVQIPELELKPKKSVRLSFPAAVRQVLIAGFATLYTWRAVLLLALAIAVIPLAHSTEMVSGLFALNHSDQRWLSFVLTIVAMQIFVILRILQLHTPERFGFERCNVTPFSLRVRACFQWGCAIALSLVPLGLFLHQLASMAGGDIGAILLGVYYGLLVFIGCVAIENVLSPEGTAQVIPIPFLRDRVRAPRAMDPLCRFVTRLFCRFIRTVDESGAGFLKGNHVLSGHMLAFFGTLALLAVYFGAFWVDDLLPGLGMGPGNVKAVFYAVLTCSLCASALSFLCFLLDLHRIPTITIVIVGWFLVCLRTNSEHYYPLLHGSATTPAPASSIWNGQNEGVIIISAQGGGIQAEAWATRVISGIAEQLPPRLQSKFVESIRLMSGVSGGSVGVMLLDTLYEKPGAAAAPLAHLRSTHTAGVCGTALSWIGFGLSYYDVTRPLLTAFGSSLRDRGYAAESAWSKLLRNGLGVQPEVTLAQLRQGVTEGTRPLLAFNATIADLGTPLVMTNFDLPSDRYEGYSSFNDLYPGYDLHLTTAARLSAAFPFVSPSPRPAVDGSPLGGAKSYAVMDGGFYDNYGIAGAYFALRNATNKFQQHAPKPVLWIQVRLPEASDGGTDLLSGTAVGPLVALNNVRETGQRSRADQLRELTLKQFQGKLAFAPFDYPLRNSPLSWALTAAQVHNIDVGWTEMRYGYQQMKSVCTFLGGSAAECEQAAAPWSVDVSKRAVITQPVDNAVCPEDATK